MAKTKYIIVVDQDADIDYSEEIKEDLEYGVSNGLITVESVEIVEDE